MSHKTRSCLTAALLLAPAAFSGCSLIQPSAPQKSSAPQQQAAPPPTSPAPSTPAAATSNVAPPVDGDLPGVKVAINELKQTSNTVTLKFTVYNSSDHDFSTQGVFDGDSFHRYRHVGAIHLIDADSKKKYFVLTDSDGNFVCSNEIANIGARSQITLWAKFPAPPDAVQKITVEIPHFVPFEDVTISR